MGTLVRLDPQSVGVLAAMCSGPCVGAPHRLVEENIIAPVCGSADESQRQDGLICVPAEPIAPSAETDTVRVFYLDRPLPPTDPTGKLRFTIDTQAMDEYLHKARKQTVTCDAADFVPQILQRQKHSRWREGSDMRATLKHCDSATIDYLASVQEELRKKQASWKYQ